MKIKNICSFSFAMKLATLFLCLLLAQSGKAQEVAILKYEGGGDWYANPTAVPNINNRTLAASEIANYLQEPQNKSNTWLSIVNQRC